MKDKSYLFEAAVTELTMNVLDSGEGFLAGEGEYPLPGRLAVLAEGFAQKMDLGEVNERLKEEGFESLYALYGTLYREDRSGKAGVFWREDYVKAVGGLCPGSFVFRKP